MGPLIGSSNTTQSFGVRVVIVGTAAALMVVTACAGTTAPPSETTAPPGTTEPTTAEPDPIPGSNTPVLYWGDPTRTTELDGGWSVSACPGEAPLLCVQSNGSNVGHLEAMAYPIESFPHLDPAADTDTNLMRLAQRFFEDLAGDRRSGCGSDYRFDPMGPDPIVLGNTPGIVFGFIGTMADDSPSEYNLQYATIVNQTIISIVVAAYDDGGCPGRDDLSGFRSAELMEFRPYLEPALHESPLPDLGT